MRQRFPSKTTMLILLTTVLAVGVAGPAAAYPPENAAVLYYKTCLTYQKPAGKIADELSDVVRGEIEPSDELVKFVEGQAQTISTIVTASRIKNCDWGHNYTEGFEMLLPGLSDMRNITRIVLGDAVIKARNGDYATTVDLCIAVFRMSRHLKDSVLISNLVAIAMESMATSVLQDALPAADAGTLKKLKAALADVAVDHNTLARSIKMELDVVAKFATPEQITRTVILATGSEAKFSDLPGDLPAKGIAYYAEYMGRIINALQLPYGQAIPEIRKIEAEMAADAKKKREAMLTTALAPAVTKALDVNVKSDTNLNALRTAVEVYLIKATTGKLPDSLPAGMPKDMFSGRDFEYKTTKTGFTLRCRAKNLKTDKIEEYAFKLAK